MRVSVFISYRVSSDRPVLAALTVTVRRDRYAQVLGDCRGSHCIPFCVDVGIRRFHAPYSAGGWWGMMGPNMMAGPGMWGGYGPGGTGPGWNTAGGGLQLVPRKVGSFFLHR